MGCDRATVRYWLRRHGLADPTSAGLSDSDAERLRHWYVERGASVQQVADRLGVSRRTATARLRQAGVEPRFRGHPRGGGGQVGTKRPPPED